LREKEVKPTTSKKSNRATILSPVLELKKLFYRFLAMILGT
jgi:hypothetical protein